MRIVIIGLTITSSWGNGHATTYRALIKALAARGHEVLFLEQDQPWYAQNRDLETLDFCRIALYRDFTELQRFAREIREAACVIEGSYVPDGVAVGRWVTETAGGVKAFYDIDTPVTLASLARGDCGYLAANLIPQFDLYLSFTGGPTLARLESEYGAPCARGFYCCVDPSLYFPQKARKKWDLGYLGTYSVDRQPALERLLITPAARMQSARFIVAGPQYPEAIQWPANVERCRHLDPSLHCSFYNSQRATLNITRADMVRAGFSPSVRLFEAAACGTPVISDRWEGLAAFFKIGAEILVADTSAEVEAILNEMPESELQAIGQRARCRVLREHTAAHRAIELEQLVAGLRNANQVSRPAALEEIRL